MHTRVLKSGFCDITQNYNTDHQAIDLVKEGAKLDYITAHTKGKVIFYQDGYDNMKGSTGNASYGNFVKIDHGNGYATLYAHMQKGLNIKNGDQVEQGQIIGYMGNSGNAYGKHLHFEVWKDGVRINPINYLDKNLFENYNLKYKIGDKVTINGVYVSSTSEEKLDPLIRQGTITRVVEGVRNPYLLDNGNIGWVNNDNIVDKTNNKYLSNPTYTGSSIVDALNQIGVDSSFNYRSKLAKINNIENYKGFAEENLKMLNLLKNGKLKSD